MLSRGEDLLVWRIINILLTVSADTNTPRMTRRFTRNSWKSTMISSQTSSKQMVNSENFLSSQLSIFFSEKLLSDAECFLDLLRFYDGICSWEQDSATPVLHVGWVKPMVKTFLSFDFSVRNKISIYSETEMEGNSNSVLSFGDQCQQYQCVPDTINNNYKLSPGDDSCDDSNLDCDDKSIYDGSREDYFVDENLSASPTENFDRMSSAKLLKFAKALDGCQSLSIEKSQHLNYLLQNSGEKLLNFEFLVGKDKTSPFTENIALYCSRSLETCCDEPFINEPIPEEPKKKSGKQKLKVRLSSIKIGALKEILLAEKINSSALNLQLTAQTQTSLDSDGGSRAKRLRKE